MKGSSAVRFVKAPLFCPLWESHFTGILYVLIGLLSGSIQK